MILVVLFFSIYFALIHLPLLSGFHPTQIPVLWSVLCLSELGAFLGERSVVTQSHLHVPGSAVALAPRTFVPVSTGCSGTALCVPKPKDLSQSLTPAVSPLVKVSNVLQNGRHVKNSLRCVAASRDLGKHNCFGVRFYLAP